MMRSMAARRKIIERLALSLASAGRRVALLFVLSTLAFAPVAMAASDDAEVPQDARTMGYPSDFSQLQLEGGTALTWLLFVALAIVGLSALFKDAKRSHLD